MAQSAQLQPLDVGGAMGPYPVGFMAFGRCDVSDRQVALLRLVLLNSAAR